MTTIPLRNIPSVGELLESAPLRTLVARISHQAVVSQVRDYLTELRQQWQTTAAGATPTCDELAQRIAERILDGEQPSLRPVINATGILLHTGLGRAPLAEEAIDAMNQVARDYASVEVDLVSGERSQRVLAVEKLLRELTGAEAAAVVNNNAGATVLALAALAAGREVIVSRGQLIEIGGSFRLPDVMATSGAQLREVGTTNKTRIGDYRAAIGEQTAALMRVHTSNYAVVGFTQQATLEELVQLGRQRGLCVIDDIGSGALVDFDRWGFADEPVAAQCIAAGADVVLFSGDKLLGGPQCGIIVGRREPLARIAKHPLMRALRVDKLTLAALAATLRLYRDPELAQQRVPLLALLSEPVAELERRAERLADQLKSCPNVEQAAVVVDVAYLGGGAVPTQQLATRCVAIALARGSLDRLAQRLRTSEPSVVGRVQQNRLLLDLRSVPRRRDDDLAQAVRAALDAES